MIGHVLLVGNFSPFEEELTKVLENNRFHIFSAVNFEEAKQILPVEKPQLVISQMILPDGDALDVVHFCKEGNYPADQLFMVFSEATENYVQITCLKAGVDDFFELPWSRALFESRLQALLRRFAQGEKSGTAQTKPTLVDKKRYAFLINQTNYALPRKQFEIIRLLSTFPGKVFSREEIKQTLWPDNQELRSRTIDVHIRKLRLMVGEEVVQTVRGVGYKFVN